MRKTATYNMGNTEACVFESQVKKLTLSSSAFQRETCSAVDVIYVCPSRVPVQGQ